LHEDKGKIDQKIAQILQYMRKSDDCV
jgi:hypothetical protein